MSMNAYLYAWVDVTSTGRPRVDVISTGRPQRQSYEFLYNYEFIRPLFVCYMNGHHINSYINMNSNVRCNVLKTAIVWIHTQSYEFIHNYEFIRPLFVGCMNGHHINSYINMNSNVHCNVLKTLIVWIHTQIVVLMSVDTKILNNGHMNSYVTFKFYSQWHYHPI
jgi:hypothetical protein